MDISPMVSTAASRRTPIWSWSRLAGQATSLTATLNEACNGFWTTERNTIFASSIFPPVETLSGLTWIVPYAKWLSELSVKGWLLYAQWGMQEWPSGTRYCLRRVPRRLFSGRPGRSELRSTAAKRGCTLVIRSHYRRSAKAGSNRAPESGSRHDTPRYADADAAELYAKLEGLGCRTGSDPGVTTTA